ncbi:hypothetical protein OG885_11885 [Streptomyces sp. NBC_00028]|uniref:hypothetical protein n=1 Tax=Streptomyces sp. NBC_00028 TaxID=2975624 RepID=UPI0032483575
MTNGAEASGALLDELGAVTPPLATEVPDWGDVALDDSGEIDRHLLNRLLPSGGQSDSGFNSSI